MVDERQEVALAASTTEPNIGAWDIQTGTFLTAYKGNTCGRNALATLGKDHLVAAQSGKGQALHFWSWHKDQPQQRSYAQEAVNSVATSSDGMYCAGGGLKGNIYLWESGSGRLLRSWSAHYKAVACLAFTNDSCLLVSGGEDAVVSTWLLMDILDASSHHNSITTTPQPLHSWSEHTLPICGMYLNPAAADPIVATVSLDRTCKIWSLSQGRLLRIINLPVALHCVTADPWEHSLFLGGGDGRIFEASLIGSGPLDAPSASPEQSGNEGLLEAAGVCQMTGHTGAVNCLSTTLNGYTLLSGSEDGSVRVWDLPSRQLLRVLQAKGPVSCILVLTKPLYMLVGRGADSGKQGPSRMQPLASFNKYPTAVEVSQPWQGPPIILDGTLPYRHAVVEAGLLSASHKATDGVVHLPGVDQDDTNALLTENKQLKDQLSGAAKTISELRATNAKMHAFLAENAVTES